MCELDVGRGGKKERAAASHGKQHGLGKGYVKCLMTARVCRRHNDAHRSGLST
nr:hypothetical protein [Beauveria bassiana]